jgi:hypothetical protein
MAISILLPVIFLIIPGCVTILFLNILILNIHFQGVETDKGKILPLKYLLPFNAKSYIKSAISSANKGAL